MKILPKITKLYKKLSYIYRLVISTPNYKLIIFLQFISGACSIIGLPMLIPVLNYMKDGTVSAGKANYIAFMEKGLSLFGLTPNFYNMLLISSALILTGQLLVFISALIAANAQIDLTEQYRKKIFDAYGKASWLWLLDSRSGEMNFSVIREASLASVAHLNAQRILIHFAQVTILLFLAIKLAPFITLIALAAYGLLAVFIALNSTLAYRLAGIYNEKFKKLSNDLTGLQQNKKFFKTSLLNERLIKGIFMHLKDITKINKKENLYIQIQPMISLLFTFLFLITVMLFHRQLSLSYSVLFLFLLVFLKLAPQFSSLSVAYTTLNSNIPVHQSLHNRLKDLYGNEEENGSEEFNGDGIIRFEKVDFSYPDGNSVFSDLDVTIEPHKTTAFVGSSGVGKSTLLDLILGLLRPVRGTIYFGDIPHPRLDKSSIRSKVAYVSQITTLIDGSMRENLTIRTSSIKEAEIKEIVNKVGLKEVINKMPKGLETEVGENGIKLSGGQRQRVALARALFTDPKILILDEATSSLDSESEYLIQQTIKSLQKDFTIIIVTHKLSAVRFADRIYVLEEGRVCETGNYKELLEKKGKLYHFDSLQK